MTSNCNLNFFAMGYFLALISSMVMPAMAKFKTGCGKQNTDPCEIHNYKDLEKVTSNGLWKSYILINNIRMPGGESFEPIGKIDNQFTGIFNGNGRGIRNLNIDRQYFNHVGLFGSVGDNAQISNLILRGPTVIGLGHVGAVAGHVTGNAKIHNIIVENPTVKAFDQYAGGLIGFGEGGNISITNVQVDNPRIVNTKIPFLSNGKTAGGLAGQLRHATLSCCHVRGGSITSTRTAVSAGGLVGSLREADIEKCSATLVDVRSGQKPHDFEERDSRCGGLIGYVYEAGITNCFATGTVSCLKGSVGGLVGYSEDNSKVSDCYTQVDASALQVRNGRLEFAAGGLFGYVRRSFLVNRSYAVGTVSAYRSGGLIGSIEHNDDSNPLKNAYCAVAPAVGNRSPGFSGTKVISGDPSYFFSPDNEPMSGWDGDVWAFGGNSHPAHIQCLLEVRAEGPYIGEPGTPIRLNKATSSAAATYFWTADNDNCSFSNPNILRPNLSCRGVKDDPIFVKASLKASFVDGTITRDIAIVAIAREKVAYAGESYRGGEGLPIPLDDAINTAGGRVKWTIDNGNCAFDNTRIVHPHLTCSDMKDNLTLVKVCLNVRFSDRAPLQHCINVEIFANNVSEAPITKVSFAKGCGGHTNPCEIFTYQDLKNVGAVAEFGHDRHYVLMNDIQADPGDNFFPIPLLTGTFDGLGHTINDLNSIQVNDLLTNGVGLFSRIQHAGEVRNLVLRNPNVVGKHQVGALVGFLDSFGWVHNVTVHNPSVNGDSEVGGLVGGMLGDTRNYGRSNTRVACCHVYGGTVKGSQSHVGGLVGGIKGSDIHQSSARGVTVNGNETVSSCGGLVGAAGSTSIISKCFAFGSVRCSGHSGGLVGGSDWYGGGGISNSYCLLDPAVGNNPAGVVGATVLSSEGPSYFRDVKNEPMSSWDARTCSCHRYLCAGIISGNYEGKLNQPIALKNTLLINGGRYHWTSDNSKCVFLDAQVIRPLLTCRGLTPKPDRTKVNVCLNVTLSDNAVIHECTVVYVETLLDQALPLDFHKVACTLSSCLHRFGGEFASASFGKFKEARSQVNSAKRLIRKQGRIAESLTKLKQAALNIEVMRRTYPDLSKDLGRSGSTCAISALEKFINTASETGVLDDGVLVQARATLNAAKLKRSNKKWRISVGQCRSAVASMMTALQAAAVPLCNN